jgi:LL-H family phage holin
MQITDTRIISLISVLIPFLLALAGWLYQRGVSLLPANKQAVVMQLAQLAVHAAEQVGEGSSGAAKKKIAQDFITSSLASLGLRVHPAIVDAAIEGLVFSLNQQQAATKQPVAGQSSTSAG